MILHVDNFQRNEGTCEIAENTYFIDSGIESREITCDAIYKNKEFSNLNFLDDLESHLIVGIDSLVLNYSADISKESDVFLEFKKKVVEMIMQKKQ